MTRERVVAAMSGGVDSAVAAARCVAAGYEVIGPLVNWMDEPDVRMMDGCTFDASGSASFFDRQVALYEGILEAGQGTGDFELAAPAPSIARGLVAMEDGLGLQVVIGHPAIGSSAAERILLDYAAAATGVDLGSVELPEAVVHTA